MALSLCFSSLKENVFPPPLFCFLLRGLGDPQLHCCIQPPCRHAVAVGVVCYSYGLFLGYLCGVFGVKFFSRKFPHSGVRQAQTQSMADSSPLGSAVSVGL